MPDLFGLRADLRRDDFFPVIPLLYLFSLWFDFPLLSAACNLAVTILPMFHTTSSRIFAPSHLLG
jgi:hypothetical protein